MKRQHFKVTFTKFPGHEEEFSFISKTPTIEAALKHFERFKEKRGLLSAQVKRVERLYFTYEDEEPVFDIPVSIMEVGLEHEVRESNRFSARSPRLIVGESVIVNLNLHSFFTGGFRVPLQFPVEEGKNFMDGCFRLMDQNKQLRLKLL